MFRGNLQGVRCRYLDQLVRASALLPRSSVEALQQNARYLFANRAPKQKGLVGKFIDNLKEGFQRGKEMQKNIKKFQEEAEKFQESSAFKTAKRQFGVLSAVKERTSEGVTKLSSTLKDGGEQLSEKASKVVEEIKLSETFKRGQQVSEELSKSAQETFSKVKEHGEELGKTETLKTVSMAFLYPKVSTNMENLGVPSMPMPNNKWSEDTMQLYNKLNELPGYSRRARHLFLSDGSRDFLHAVEEKGMFFEYAFFGNPSLQTLKGVVQFGVHTRGHLGHVHGGAIATIFDVGFGTCCNAVSLNSVTANLNVNYLRPLPLNSTVLLEMSIDKTEGRKVFLSSSLKTVDGSETYATSTAIYVRQKKSSL